MSTTGENFVCQGGFQMYNTFLKLMFEYSCLHFSTTTFPHPTHPHLPPSILPHFPTLALSMGPLYMFIYDPFPSFPHYFPPPPPLYNLDLKEVRGDKKTCTKKKKKRKERKKERKIDRYKGKKKGKPPRPVVKSKDYFEPTFSIPISVGTLTNYSASLSLSPENKDNMIHPVMPDIS